MTTGEYLQKLRKEKNLSQEELAEIMGVSRQSVSKWEMNSSYPETEKLIKLASFYNVSVDNLINPDYVEEKSKIYIPIPRFHYEYKSTKTIFGLPLLHINIGKGLYVSRGIISIGNISRGIISIGTISLGIISLGILSIGLFSIAVVALGLILALGSIALGVVAIGAIAVGFFTIGAISIGYFSIGALSIAKYVAIGDTASGLIAIGKTEVSGTYTYLGTVDNKEVHQIIDSEVPRIWSIFIEWIKIFIN